VEELIKVHLAPEFLQQKLEQEDTDKNIISEMPFHYIEIGLLILEKYSSLSAFSSSPFHIIPKCLFKKLYSIYNNRLA
jgi:hypothetical protein